VPKTRVSPSEHAGFLFHDVSKVHWRLSFAETWLGPYFMLLKMLNSEMPKMISPLTDIQLHNAKSAEKPYSLSDGGGGMYVEEMPNESECWRMKA